MIYQIRFLDNSTTCVECYKVLGQFFMLNFVVRCIFKYSTIYCKLPRITRADITRSSLKMSKLAMTFIKKRLHDKETN